MVPSSPLVRQKSPRHGSLTTRVILMLMFVAACQGENGKLGVVRVAAKGETFSFCLKYFPSFKMLPEDKSEAEPRQLVNMTAQDGCLPLRKINLTNKVALIRDLGHCPLETVAKNFREVKAYGLVVGLSGSKLDDVVYEGSHLSPSTCCRIRQQKELIKVDGNGSLMRDCQNIAVVS
ncbi:hypothetical protein HPB52_004714 [Rhipicephalus sanguineus]|uniref:Uncharacterized protein n=1 Tax=Rhipicephalus sanguineus TaxID=34632 RepID=A0A9D4SUA4_RHISA|nr:hypothetical protein HPB52_004714 [Rhipicephalus sanguineus]